MKQSIKARLKIFLILTAVMLISSCNLLDYLKREEKPGELYIINIDPKAVSNNLVLPGSSPLNIEIYFVRNSYLIENNNEPLTCLLKSLNISESSSYVTLSRNSYEIVPNKKIRDSIELDKKARKVILILRKENKVISHKIIKIDPKKTTTLNIELINQSIKT